MAIVNYPAATVTYTLIDETGSKSYMTLNVASDADSAAVISEAAGLVPEIEAVTDCSILGYSLTYTSKETEQPAPAAGSRVERKANLGFVTEAAKAAMVTVPGIIDAAVEKSGKVNEDHAAVAALVSALIGGSWTDSNGVALSALTQAYETFRRTSKGQKPSLRVPDADTTA